MLDACAALDIIVVVVVAAAVDSSAAIWLPQIEIINNKTQQWKQQICLYCCICIGSAGRQRQLFYFLCLSSFWLCTCKKITANTKCTTKKCSPFKPTTTTTTATANGEELTMLLLLFFLIFFLHNSLLSGLPSTADLVHALIFFMLILFFFCKLIFFYRSFASLLCYLFIAQQNRHSDV